MATLFTLTTGINNFTGVANDDNEFLFTSATLQSTDTITGGSTGGFIDLLALTSAGTISAAQFAGVTNVEQLDLPIGTNNITLTNGLVSGSSLGYFVIADGTGDDTVDGSTITTEALHFYASGGNDTYKGGGGGNDYLFAPVDLTSADTIVGGAGFDVVQLTAGGALAANALANVSNIEAIFLSNAGNGVTLTNGSIAGSTLGYLAVVDGSGNDTVDASGVTAGTTVVYASGGGDTFTGGSGSSSIYYLFAPTNLTSADTIHGGAGFDVVQLTAAGALAANALANVTNIDALYLSSGGNSVTLTNGAVAGSSLGYFVVVGGAGNDSVDATAVSGSQIHFYANGGSDAFTGGSGTDIFTTSAANLDASDSFNGDGGTDYLQIATNGAVSAASLAGVSNIEFLELQSGGSVVLANTLATSRLVADGSGAADSFDGSGVTSYAIDFHGFGGADTMKGGSQADGFYIQDSNFASIDGGGGNDFVILTQSNQTLDVTANASKIQNIEAIWLDDASNTSVTLAGTDITNITSGNTLYIVGGSDDQVSAGAGYTLLATNQVNNAIAPGHTFSEYSHSSGSLLFVDSLISLTISAATNQPPTVLLAGFGGAQSGANFSAAYTTGNVTGVVVADTDAVVDDPDAADTPGISAHIADLTATLTDPHSGSSEFLTLTAAGHTILTNNGLGISGENTAALTITGSATDTVYQSLLDEIRYVDTDLSNSSNTSDRHVTVSVHDGVGAQSNVATTTIQLSVGQAAPIAANDLFQISEDGALDGNVLLDNGSGADSDPNGDAVTVDTVNGSAANLGTVFTLFDSANNAITAGTVELDSNGHITFTPVANWSGSTSLTYTLTDGTSTGASATVTIDVSPVADTPNLVVNQTGPTESVGAANDLPFLELHTLALPGGSFVAVWTAGRDDGTGAGADENVYMQTFDSQGLPTGSEIAVSDPNALDDNLNIPVALQNGDFAVTWQRDGNIYLRVYHPDGTEVTSGEQPVTSSIDPIQPAQVISLSDGDFAVMWGRNDGGVDQNVYVRIHHPDGTPASGEVMVNDPNSPDPDTVQAFFGPLEFAEHSQIVALEHGFAVLWSSSRADGSDVFVRAFNPDGTPATSEIEVNAPNGVFTDFNYATQIVGLGHDSFAVLWERDDTSAGPVGVVSREFNIDFGTQSFTSSTKDEANTPPVDANDQPQQLTALSNGGYVTLWGHYDQLDSDSHVFIQVYDANGNLANPANAGGIQVDSVSGNGNFPDEVIALANGNFAVLWEAGGVGFGDPYVRLYQADGTAITGDLQVSPQDGQLYTGDQIVALADGSFDVVYTLDVFPAIGEHCENLFVQHMSASGNRVGAPDLIASSPHFSAAEEDSYFTEFRLGQSSTDQLFTGDVAAHTFTPFFDYTGSVALRMEQFVTGGDQGDPIELPGITTMVTDTDGSETLKLVLSDFPAGSTFTLDGAAVGALDTDSASATFGDWIISDAATIAALAHTPLMVNPPPAFVGDFVLHAEAVVTDSATLSTGPSVDHTAAAADIDVQVVTNHAPIAVADNDMFVIEDSLPFASCDAIGNDSDPDGDAIHVTNPGLYDGVYGQLQLNVDGTYAYTMWTDVPGATDAQIAKAHSLGGTETDVDVFNYSITDGKSAPVSSTITLAVTGSEDDPVLGPVLAADHYEAMPLGTGGNQSNDESDAPSISMDGRYVAFTSFASNLTADDGNGSLSDIFVWDREAGTLTRMPPGLDPGTGPDSGSFNPSISADGNYVAFVSQATDLTSDPNANNAPVVFLWNRLDGTVTSMSHPDSSEPTNAGSMGPSISADGHFVAFYSNASDLTPGDTDGHQDIFLWDATANTLARMPLGVGNAQPDGDSLLPSISADGRFVGFQSQATDLVAGDTNGFQDIFVWDRLTDTTQRMPLGVGNAEPNGASSDATLSGDGRFVAFDSAASKLTADDGNGSTNDVFVWDRQTNTVERMPKGVGGADPNDGSFVTSISADGRFVSFWSFATNLVDGRTPDGLSANTYVWDRETGTTSMMPLGIDTNEPNNLSFLGTINFLGNMSADGRAITFNSDASNLTPGDGNNTFDVFTWAHTVDNVVASFVEKWDVTGSAAPYTAGGSVSFSDLDLSDTHTVPTAADLVSALWSEGTGPGSDLGAIPTDAQTALANALSESLTTDSTGTGQGALSWSFSASDHTFDFLKAGEKLTLTYDLAVTDQPAGQTAATPISIVITGAEDLPQISNPDAVVVAAGADPLPLGIAAPTDADVHDTLTITVTSLPGYGTIQYFDGVSFVPITTTGTTLTPDQLASIEYVAPAGGIHGGDSFGYSVSDGSVTETGNVAIDVNAPALLFSATTPAVGTDLFQLDSAGNFSSFDIHPGPDNSYASEDGGFIQFGNDLYFMAAVPQPDNPVFTANGLVKMDPSGTVTAVSDGQSGGQVHVLADSGATSANFSIFDGHLFLMANTINSADDVVRIDADGSVNPIGINPFGPDQFNNTFVQNPGFVAFDNHLYFTASSAATGIDLFRLDTATSATPTALDVNPGASSSFAGELGGFVVFNDTLYFHAFSPADGDVLFSLAAGSSTPTEVTDGGSPLYNFFGFSAFHVASDGLFFTDTDLNGPFSSDALYKLDAGNTITPIEFNGDGLTGAGQFGGFAEFNGALYFTAAPESTGVVSLFKVADGTTAATEVDPSLENGFGINLVSGFAVFDNHLYFDAYKPASANDVLYSLDTSDNLTIALDSGTTNAGVSGGFTQFGGDLYFSAYTGDGYELAKLAPGGAITSYDINPGPGANSTPGQEGLVSLPFGGFIPYPSDQPLLASTPGNDILSGTASGDTFVFTPNFGKDTVTNFQPGIDLLQLDHSVFTDFTDVIDNHTQQVGADAVIFDGASLAGSADTITLRNVLATNLHASDFHVV